MEVEIKDYDEKYNLLIGYVSGELIEIDIFSAGFLDKLLSIEKTRHIGRQLVGKTIEMKDYKIYKNGNIDDNNDQYAIYNFKVHDS